MTTEFTQALLERIESAAKKADINRYYGINMVSNIRVDLVHTTESSPSNVLALCAEIRRLQEAGNKLGKTAQLLADVVRDCTEVMSMNGTDQFYLQTKAKRTIQMCSDFLGMMK